MHVDYVKEVYHSLKNPKYTSAKSDLEILMVLCVDDFVDFAKEEGDEKIFSICEKMQESFGYRNNSSKIRSKITEKQRYAVSSFLLSKYETTKDVISKVFKIDVSSIDLA